MRAQPRPCADTTVVIFMGTFCPQLAALAYTKLARLFEARGYKVVVLAIPRLGLGRIDEASDELARKVFALGATQHFILVGHSQGSLIALHLARYYPERVRAVFCFGAPFHGTRLANLGRIVWLPAIRTMAAHSRFLHELREDQTYTAENVHSLFSVLDELVVPWFASTVAGAHNVVMAPAWMHGLLIRAGLTRSHGIELVDGVADHLGVIWHSAFRTYIEHELDRLEGGYLELVA